MATEFEFGVLGPLQVLHDGRQLELAGTKQRSVLALLLLRANEVVSTDVLIDRLWGSKPPGTAANTLQVYISQLRKVLPPDTLVTQPPGYMLRVGTEQVDLHRFERLAAEGRDGLARGEPGAAAEMLREALALWRGEPLADVAFESFAQTEILRLEELRLAALEDRIEADLALGRHGAMVGELEALVREHPLRERLRGQLMLALYRSGRQAEALEEYQKARRTLVDELGIDPGPALQQLEKAILTQDPSLDAAPAAPTPRSTPPGAPRLPVPPTPLLGRDGELAEACALARREDVRLVTFTGPGGIGKTRLGLELARQLEHDFADGAWFVPLAPIRDADLVESTVAQRLGVVNEPLQEHLRDRELVLLLDNFEQLVASAPLLAELLASARGLKLLVTSRAVLRVSGEHEFPVPPLGLPEWSEADPSALLAAPSVQLFVQRAEAVKPDFELTDANSEAVAAICARLEGLPLAIELAAARTKLLPPEVMLARLSRRLDLLTGGARDAPERQQTLRGTIDWSYQLLRPEEQRLFARLAVFVGGAPLEAAEAVCAEDGTGVLDGLAALADESLLRRRGEAEARFAMLETVREYALERLAASGEEEEIRRRHLAFYLQVAQGAEGELTGPDQLDWLARLVAEHDNIRAALTFALDRGDGESALQICSGVIRFWEYHGHLAEGRRMLDAALEQGTEAPPLLRMKALNRAGILAGEQGDFDAAERHFIASLELARELGNAERAAAATGNLGNLAMFRGDYERARELLEEGREIWLALGEDAQAAIVVEALGLLALLREDLDEAESLLEEALAAARRAQHAHSIASILHLLGRVLLARGNADRAAALVDDALVLVRDLHEPRLTADCLETAAGLAAVGGDAPSAAVLFGAAHGLRTSIAGIRPPDQQPWYDRYLELARAALDPEQFEAAFARGQTLALDDAVAAALGTGAAAA